MSDCQHLKVTGSGIHKEKDNNGVMRDYINSIICVDCSETLITPPLTISEAKKIWQKNFID